MIGFVLRVANLVMCVVHVCLAGVNIYIAKPWWFAASNIILAIMSFVVWMLLTTIAR